ncbi:Spo0E family sporulation regulatory protein-aspartic acid phosphatase [Lederbergia wuyishanensis]|uniref:Prefoldin subunit 5 n=1 Tax=Lederbergia wuyishanensis TaxID=1347903 RepID=A0ABU0D2B5_9BACI|nr:aspartyl-phosphate phosphatase Spo0E family protein [Lederbergia wuyishanensis]MCJ8007313.1 aspartyl-phosphate phosphatase Spo0E family protein [Lederbergia wuyishanensis]MDQ0342523.1 prefoldin subunit 5 [Lederbergia wuyishanensis]
MKNKQIEELSQQIQHLRKQLNELAKAKVLSDPEVIETSQKLDGLLNDFELLIKTKE